MIVGSLTGSITQTPDGKSFIVAGSNITVSSASNGQITIASTGGGSGGPTTVPLVEGLQSTTLAGYTSVGAQSLNISSSYAGLGVTFEAMLQVSNSTRFAYVRLFNVTDGIQIVELTNSSSVSRTTPTKISSSLLAIPTGEKVYEVHIKIDAATSDAAICKSAQLRMS